MSTSAVQFADFTLLVTTNLVTPRPSNTAPTATSRTSITIPGFSTIITQPTRSINDNIVVAEPFSPEVEVEDEDEDDTSFNFAISPDVAADLVSTTTSTTVTETEASESTASSTPSTSGSSRAINPGGVAAIVVSSILVFVVLSIAVVVLIRRHRRQQRQTDSARLLPLRQNPWVVPTGPTRSLRSRALSVESMILPLHATELPSTAPVIPELALRTPLGIKQDSAELDRAELEGDRSKGHTWSWMSRASRASKHWSGKSWKTRSSTGGRSSFRWTARSAASMQTTSTGHYSGDWQSFARGKWPDGLGLPAVPTGGRPLPEVPKTPGSAKMHLASYIKPDDDLNRWSRISDGTFGAPGKSPVSSRFSRPED